MLVDKHDSDWNFIPPPDLLGGVKSQIIKFCNNSFINIFIEISHADRGTIDMKHIKRDSSLKAWVRPPGWT